jgi:hypothetical protein
MEKEHFYYKTFTDEGFKYYALKVTTEQPDEVDEVLDQINKMSSIFITKEEFEANIVNQMELNVKDSETETITLGTLIFEAIDLDYLTDDNELII